MYTFRHAKLFLLVMFDFTILLILLLWTISMIISLPMNCYSNARLDLPTSAILYNNFTLESCQCLMIQQTLSGFQYDSIDNSCYAFSNDSSRSDLRVKIDSQVCFINRTSIVCIVSKNMYYLSILKERIMKIKTIL